MRSIALSENPPIKIGTDDLCLIEFELEPTHEGLDPHSHTDQSPETPMCVTIVPLP